MHQTLFFRNPQKRSLTRNVYGPQSGFPYYNPTTPHRKGTTTCGRAGHLYGLRPGNRHQYLVMTMLNFIP